MTDAAGRPGQTARTPIARADLDYVLSAQIAVAWAGEGGEEPRLGWWRSDLASEFGGEDLFRRLLPNTWRWATLQSAREAARRRDAEIRSRDHDPDRIVSLYRLGPEPDERLDERLQDLKASGVEPVKALPGLADIVTGPWKPERFAAWLEAHATEQHASAPIGRRLKGDPPGAIDALVRNILGALAPLGEEYPLPHYRRGK
jgi:hypothetical protein